jgi:predicted nucleic acid-binding protein
MSEENTMREVNYFLDSNIFLRPIVKDDLQKVKECENLFEKIKKGELKVFTSNLVLAEIVWVCSSFYEIRKEAILKILKSILKFKNLKIIDKFDTFLAIELFENYNVKFIDALIASNPAIFKKEVVVVSYDKEFDKIGVKRIEPRKI